MEIHASARYLRLSPKKLRFVATMVRGLDVVRAEEQLEHLRRRSTHPVQKLLASAVANAEHNFDLLKENLYVRSVRVNEGPTLHRYRPRAFGRATPIRKRSAHLLLVLDERQEGVRGGRARREKLKSEEKKKEEKKAPPREMHARPKDDEQKKDVDGHAREAEIPSRVASRHHEEGRKGPPQQKKGRGFLKKFFSRKAG